MWSCWAPMVPSCHYNELPLLWSAHLVSMSSKYCDRDELTICIFVNIVIALSWCCCDNQEITPIPLFFIQICTHTPTQSRTVCIAYTPTSLSPNISHLNFPHFHFHFNGIFKGTNMLSVSLWTRVWRIYSNIFYTNIHSDIRLYQFSLYEYIRIFVRIIFLIWIYSDIRSYCFLDINVYEHSFVSKIYIRHTLVCMWIGVASFQTINLTNGYL